MITQYVPVVKLSAHCIFKTDSIQEWEWMYATGKTSPATPYLASRQYSLSSKSKTIETSPNASCAGRRQANCNTKHHTKYFKIPLASAFIAFTAARSEARKGCRASTRVCVRKDSLVGCLSAKIPATRAMFVTPDSD